MTTIPTPDQTAPRVRTSATTEQFDEAFAKAQAKFEAAVKGNVNPAFRSKYADVSSVIDATLEHLNSEGIGVKQHPGFEYKTVGDGVEAFMVVTTRLTFKGQWEESDIAIPAIQRDKFDAQSCGSALTYACRYALQGIFVVRREDDDANTATGRGTSEAAQAAGQAKVAELKKKAGKSPANGPSVPTLFFTRLENGSFELVNVKEFGSTLNEVAAEGLRLTLKKYVQSVNGDLIVPKDRFEGLEQELTDCKVPFREIAGA